MWLKGRPEGHGTMILRLLSLLVLCRSALCGSSEASGEVGGDL